jgi:hypothetical protein
MRIAEKMGEPAGDEGTSSGPVVTVG